MDHDSKIYSSLLTPAVPDKVAKVGTELGGVLSDITEKMLEMIIELQLRVEKALRVKPDSYASKVA